MLIATLVALSAAAVTPPATPAPLKPICRNPGIVPADAPSGVAIRPLADAPPARHIKAVVRAIQGCNMPIVINAEVGTPRR